MTVLPSRMQGQWVCGLGATAAQFEAQRTQAATVEACLWCCKRHCGARLLDLGAPQAWDGCQAGSPDRHATSLQQDDLPVA